MAADALPIHGDEQRFTELVWKNRVAPLLAPQIGSFGEAYRKCLLRGMEQLGIGCDLARALEADSIPCIALRGAFAASELYGDVAARYSADIDLLVPFADRDRALTAMNRQGYEIRHPLIPKWFNKRNHFHWSLCQSKTGTLCDIHWAIHHAFKLLKVDYDAIFERAVTVRDGRCAWRSPAPEDLLLLTAIHLSRECDRARQWAADSEGWSEIVNHGLALQWLDVAAVIRKYSSYLDWEEVLRRSREWRADGELGPALFGAAKWLKAPVPLPVLETMGCGVRMPAYEAIASWVLFRRMRDLPDYRGVFVRTGIPYLVPSRNSFPALNGLPLLIIRILHFIRASLRLMLGALEALLCAWMVGHRKRARAPETGHA